MHARLRGSKSLLTLYQIIIKIVSMIRKYHNHKLQTTPWHREEEHLNHHETPGRQIKQSNQLSLPDFPSLADEIAEPRPDMNITFAAFTVSEKSINTCTTYMDHIVDSFVVHTAS